MAAILIPLLLALVATGALLGVVPLLIYLERKISAFIQGREGPNRVHLSIGGQAITPRGILQPLADAIKLIFKEDAVPARADRFFFFMAPWVAVVTNAATFCVIPFGSRIQITEDTPVLGSLLGAMEINLQVADANAGILVILALSSLAVYALAFGGWSANSKYPLMGGLRATAQVISYEITLGLALVSVLLTAGTLDLQEIVQRQAAGSYGILSWNVFTQPLACLLLVIAAFAENNRLPFDLPEAEPELVGGYHTEYSGLKFAMFFMGEYIAMITMSSVVVTLFFGGWSLPGVVDPAGSGLVNGLLSVLVFAAKTGVMLFLYIHVRWSIPRFRYDTLMGLGWKKLVPISLANIAVTALVLAL